MTPRTASSPTLALSSGRCTLRFLVSVMIYPVSSDSVPLKLLSQIRGPLHYVAFTFNRFIFNEYTFSFGVNWIFIPSGLQLVLVLTAVEDAAIGIALASWLIGFQYYYLDSDVNTIITGIITGASPLLARKISFDFLHIEDDLKNLTFKSILLMSIIFALLSATLHQLWFFYNHVSDQFINNLLVMVIGNLTGTIVVLFIIKVAASLIKRHNSPIE